MNLFSEVYGCYFTVVDRILRQAQTGTDKSAIEQMIKGQAFSDSAFHMLPKLFSGEWDLLEQHQDGRLYAKPQLSGVIRPMTHLEMAWLKTLLTDPRIFLFLTAQQHQEISKLLSDVEPLFSLADFHPFDMATDGDPYGDEKYRARFQFLLRACKEQLPVDILYVSEKKAIATRLTLLPLRFVYSSRDDKFRLLALQISNKNNLKKCKLNLGRVVSVVPTERDIVLRQNINIHLNDRPYSTPIELLISKERNALERCMLQFASWEKQTEYDETKQCYRCKIYYDRQEETELLIRILSFGPVVKVVAPAYFVQQIKERITQQYQRNTQPLGGMKE